MTESTATRSRTMPARPTADAGWDRARALAAAALATPGRRFAALLIAITALHATLAALFPLSGDEAYYWDCSRHPDWSYFDQPPLVIWAMIPARALLGETALAVRLPAIVAGLLVGVFLLRLARRLGGGEREAATAYLTLQTLPLFLIGWSYASTDAGMVACYIAATWAAVAIAQGQRRAWWGFAVAIGLGFLAKNTVVLVLAALIPVAARREGRRWLREPTPYLAALLAAALTLPVWIWGWQHGWDNIAFQLVGRHRGAGWSLKYVAEFLGANALLTTPPIAVAIGVALWRRRDDLDPGWRALIFAAAAPLVGWALVALRMRVGAHWSAPGIVAGALALALTPFPRRRGLAAAGVIAGALTSAAALVAVASPATFLGLDWTYAERPNRISTSRLATLLRNREIAAALAGRVRPGEMVVSESYSTVHLLAFLSEGRLETRLANLNRGRHGLASLYWYSESDVLGRPVLFVTSRAAVGERLTELFTDVRYDGAVTITEGGELVREVHLYRCSGVKNAALLARLPS